LKTVVITLPPAQQGDIKTLIKSKEAQLVAMENKLEKVAKHYEDEYGIKVDATIKDVPLPSLQRSNSLTIMEDDYNNDLSEADELRRRLKKLEESAEKKKKNIDRRKHGSPPRQPGNMYDGGSLNDNNNNFPGVPPRKHINKNRATGKDIREFFSGSENEQSETQINDDDASSNNPSESEESDLEGASTQKSGKKQIDLSQVKEGSELDEEAFSEDDEDDEQTNLEKVQERQKNPPSRRKRNDDDEEEGRTKKKVKKIHIKKGKGKNKKNKNKNN